MADYIDRTKLLKKHIHFVKGEEFNLNRPVAVVRTKDIYNMPSVDGIEQKHEIKIEHYITKDELKKAFETEDNLKLLIDKIKLEIEFQILTNLILGELEK